MWSLNDRAEGFALRVSGPGIGSYWRTQKAFKGQQAESS